MNQNNKLLLFWLLNGIVQSVCMVEMCLNIQHIVDHPEINHGLFLCIFNAFMSGALSYAMAIYSYCVDSCHDRMGSELRGSLAIISIFNLVFLILAIVAICLYAKSQTTVFIVACIISNISTGINIIFTCARFIR